MDGEVKVGAYHTPHEAELAAMHLRSRGIDARVENAVLVGMNPLWDTALGGVRLMVPEHQAKRAQRVLAKFDAEPENREEPPESSRPEDDPRSPTDAGDAVAARAFRAAILGIFFCPVGFHVYALWLAANAGETLSARGLRMRLWARLVSAVVIAAGLLAILSAAGASSE